MKKKKKKKDEEEEDDKEEEEKKNTMNGKEIGQCKRGWAAGEREYWKCKWAEKVCVSRPTQ